MTPNTPKSQQQEQQWYKISEEELGRIRSVIVEDSAHEYQTDFFERVRSRPIAPQPADATDKPQCKFIGGHCVFIMQSDRVAIAAAAKVEGRKEALEDVVEIVMGNQQFPTQGLSGILLNKINELIKKLDEAK